MLKMLPLNTITVKNTTILLAFLPLLVTKNVSPRFSHSCVSNVRTRNVC